jgi:hypothetical protein
MRSLVITGLFLLGGNSLFGAEKSFIEIQLKKDQIELSSSLKTGANPLQNELRPKNTPLAVDYEYYAWSEINDSGEFALYKWELVSSNSENASYELAKYKVKITPSQKEFLEKNKNALGGLTHKNLRVGSESENYLIFTKPSTETSPALTKAQVQDALLCLAVPGKTGFVFSPTETDDEGNRLLIDARGLPPGSLVKDPYTKKVVRLPNKF